MTRGEFASHLLKDLGAEKSLHNRRAIATWIQSEGAGGDYNPLNTTEHMPGSSTFNSAGVQNYRDAEQGLLATLKTLRGSSYSEILACLRRNAPAAATIHAIGQSPWGTDETLMLHVLALVKRDLPSLESKPITH